MFRKPREHMFKPQKGKQIKDISIKPEETHEIVLEAILGISDTVKT
jgi:hypothetical protein